VNDEPQWVKDAVTLHDHFDGRITLRVAQPQPQYGTVQLNSEYKGDMLSVDVNLADLREALDTVAGCRGCGHDPHPVGLCTAQVHPVCDCNEDDGTITRDVRVREVLELLPDVCYVTQTEFRCTDMIGGTIGNATFVEEMCCLPCRIRKALGAP